MYLKELRAYGFKSFADKTRVEFCKNVNGIVGPNGSGKSNIVDSVRWVLGEQSMKSLRGDSSLDVIFSGSESRKPLNSASVSLIFDNTDKTLPIDFDEVSIKRMAFRTGENEYYINNERVRLKDIIELLSDSGTAKESFNIISQGKIDEILSNKPEDRRIIFEEAAGVLKYKRRKEEALRKLDRTNQNLNRVNDIILELEGNVVPLEEASKRAIRYKDVKDKLSNIEVASIAKMISDLNFEYKEDKEKIQSQNQEFSMEGLRVLAFTYREIPENHVLTTEDENQLVFLGLIAMMDPPREESKAAVAECIKAGIRPVMITGDHNITAAAIAKRIGILQELSEA